MTSLPDLLLHVTLRASLIILGCGALLWAWRSVSASERYFCWRLALIAVLSLPALMLALPPVDLPWLPAPQIHVTYGESLTVRSAPAPTSAAAPEMPTFAQQLPAPKAATTSSQLLNVWLLGVCLYALWYMWEWRRLRAWHRSSQCVDANSPLGRKAAGVAAELGLCSSWQLRLQPVSSHPVTAGILRPVVYLPESAASWPEARTHLVLWHELTHVRRRDGLYLALTHVFTAMQWFNPLAWLLRRELITACEVSCDDTVLRQGADPVLYANTLLEFAGQPLRLPGQLAMGAFARLRRRIQAIGRKETSRQELAPARAVTLTALGLVGVILAASAHLVPTRAEQMRQPSGDAPADDDLILDLKARVIEIPNEAISQLGIEWRIQMPDFEKTFLPRIVTVLGPSETTALLKRLEHLDEVDLISSPSVRVREGQDATINVTRPLHYPIKFDGVVIERDQQGGVEMVVPSFPTEFANQDVGLTMKYTGEVCSDGTIDLQFAAQMTEFKGFVIYSPGVYMKDKGKTERTLVTENVMNQPVFENRSLDVRVKVLSNQTVVLAGFISDLSIDGKGHERRSDTHQLVVLVTAEIIGQQRQNSSIGDASSPRVEPTASTITTGIYPYAIAADGDPGFVRSPYAEDQGMVDIRGFSAGTHVKCPFTGKIFRVP